MMTRRVASARHLPWKEERRGPHRHVAFPLFRAPARHRTAELPRNRPPPHI